MWAIAADIAEFALKIFTGDVWKAWKEHKAWEAINVQNKVASMSDTAIADKLQQYTKPN